LIFERGNVANDGEFREQVNELGKLIGQFGNLPDGPQKTAGNKLVQLLMDIHGAGLERMMEIIFESGSEGSAMIEKLGRDSIAGSLLVLYSLHPDDLETRVRRALERLRPRLRKLACAAELESVNDGAVRINLSKAGHSCGSSAKELQAMVEDGVYELAPDVISLEIQGLEEPSAAGFVALESLLGHALVPAGSGGHSLQTDGAD
jgi:Fe-S cluster biogenesis protein NfuA